MDAPKYTKSEHRRQAARLQEAIECELTNQGADEGHPVRIILLDDALRGVIKRNDQLRKLASLLSEVGE